MSNNFNWATSSQGVNQPVNTATDGTYLYVLNSFNGTVSRILLSNPNSYTYPFISTGNVAGTSYGITVTGGYVYIGAMTTYISKWNASTGALVSSTWGNLNTSGDFVILSSNDTYIYALTSGSIYRFSLSNGAQTPTGAWFSGVSGRALYVYDTYLYTFTSSNNIVRIQLSNASSTVLVTNANFDNFYGIATNGDIVYTSHQSTNSIHRYVISTNTLTLNWLTSASFESPCGLTISNLSTAYLYVSNFSRNTISQIEIPTTFVSYPCFKRDTKILTNQGYIPIQRLRKGHLVKTLNDGYVPVYMLGKSTIHHNASDERIKTQLYRCPQSAYPELTEDLVLTGCHSILVKKFKNAEERQSTIVVNGNIYSTDNLYRLPACVDTRAVVYETPGEYTIYHLALENEDYYMNYGIYANGLLVESCSKRYLKELSNMKLISQ